MVVAVVSRDGVEEVEEVEVAHKELGLVWEYNSLAISLLPSPSLSLG